MFSHLRKGGTTNEEQNSFKRRYLFYCIDNNCACNSGRGKYICPALPSSVTQYDISSTKLYSITSNTKVVVNALKEDDDEFTGSVQNGKEDDVIEKLLDKYDALSDHIKYKRRIRIFIRHLPRNIQVMRLPTTV